MFVLAVLAVASGILTAFPAAGVFVFFWPLPHEQTHTVKIVDANAAPNRVIRRLYSSSAGFCNFTTLRVVNIGHKISWTRQKSIKWTQLKQKRLPRRLRPKSSV